MDGSTLSARERHIWQQIETALEQDDAFGRHLQHPERRRTRCAGLNRSAGRSLALLSTVSLSLMIAAVALSYASLIIAFGSVCAVTIAIAVIWLSASFRTKDLARRLRHWATSG
ncbi:DUF3040 domain-containing protein [Streptomyces sp. NPDC058985]|uniref:DUF3040 domain-containing protein n=1 Tax=Streptomyces sp. NPDC058985 TaxID=3346684 RepID=UPI0036C43D40